MKSAHEIFLKVGVSIPHPARESGLSPNYQGFRAFTEHDIKAIQDEAFKAGLERAAFLAARHSVSSGAALEQAILAERDQLP